MAIETPLYLALVTSQPQKDCKVFLAQEILYVIYHNSSNIMVPSPSFIDP